MPLSALELSLAEWILLVGCGAVLGADAVSWGQTMISRPIVSATVGGFVLGDPGAGFLVGALLEVLALRHPPFGAARYPDTGPAGLVAGSGYAAAGGEGLAPLVVAALGGWAVGWIGARTVHLFRVLNGRLVGDVDALARAPERLEGRHRTAVRLDGLRAALVTAAFLLPVALGTRLAASVPAGGTEGWAAALVAGSLGVAAGAGGRNLGVGRRWWPAFLAGGAVAVVMTSW